MDLGKISGSIQFLLYIVGKLAEGGSVAVAVVVSDMLQVTRWQGLFLKKNRNSCLGLYRSPIVMGGGR